MLTIRLRICEEQLNKIHAFVNYSSCTSALNRYNNVTFYTLPHHDTQYCATFRARCRELRFNLARLIAQVSPRNDVTFPEYSAKCA